MDNMTGPSVRPALQEDARGIARLATELRYPADSSEIGQRLGVIQQRPDHFVSVAIDGAEKLVGWIHAERRHSVTSGERAEVVGLVVDPGARRGGIGRALVVAAERWAGNHGLLLMTVRSNIVRDESHAFYQKLGFDRSKTQHFYKKSLPARQGLAS